MKKKILYIHHGKGLGGAPLSLLYLIQALDKSKYQPIVLFLHDSPVLEVYKNLDIYKNKTIDVIGPVNLYDFPHTKIWWFRWYHVLSFLRCTSDTLLTLVFGARYWLKKIEPDIVHLNTSSLIAWGKVAKKMGIPVVWHIREPLADGYLGLRKKLITNCVKKHAHTIVSICKNDACPWEKLSKTHVIYNTVDQKIFDHRISPESFLAKYNLENSNQDSNILRAPKILFLGGLSQEKGTLVILSVFKKLLEVMPNAKLLLAGYFPEQSNRSILISSLIKKLFPAHKYTKQVFKILASIKESVIFLGPILDVPGAMAASSVVVFPATIGHFARPIIEAGFMKKPVVASCLAPLDELVIDEKTGFLVDPKAIDIWVQKLTLLLINQAYNKHMGQQAYEFCRVNFGLEMHISKIEKIYEKIL
ncbi:MAG: glycosyltransferase family 4 protein [bacterium]